MNIWFDHKKNFVFSIGEDKYLKCYNIGTKELLTCKYLFFEELGLDLNINFLKAAKVSKAKLTFAIPLLDFGFAIISDRDGRLNIFDTHCVRI